jgi:5-methylcytosine-specific restriction endonuclease McrA
MPRKRTLTVEDMGSAAWKELRLKVLARDGHTCQLCGRPATHCDHIVPRSQGGRSVPENLRATCAKCNLLKSRSESSLAALARRANGVPAAPEDTRVPFGQPRGDVCPCPSGCRCKARGGHLRHWCI